MLRCKLHLEFKTNNAALIYILSFGTYSLATIGSLGIGYRLMVAYSIDELTQRYDFDTCMKINKSQSQCINKVVHDCTLQDILQYRHALPLIFFFICPCRGLIPLASKSIHTPVTAIHIMWIQVI